MRVITQYGPIVDTPDYDSNDNIRPLLRQFPSIFTHGLVGTSHVG